MITTLAIWLLPVGLAVGGVGVAQWAAVRLVERVGRGIGGGLDDAEP